LRSATERAAVARPRVPPGRAHAPLSLRLAVVGTSLIGASVGLAAQRTGARVVGWDADPHALGVAVERGAVEPASSLEDALAGAELAVVAVPIASLPSQVAAVLEGTGEGTTVTDVGSAEVSV